MLEWVEKTIEDLKEKDYWENHHIYSKLAKVAIDLCIRVTDKSILEITEKDTIDESNPDDISFAILWFFDYAYKEIKPVFDFDYYMVDSMSFLYDWNIIDLLFAYGSYHFRMLYGNRDNRNQILREGLYHIYEVEQVQQIDAIIGLVLGKDTYGIYKPSPTPTYNLANKIHDKIIEYRNTGIEPIIHENYNCILDNVIYNINESAARNKIKLTEINSLLYALAYNIGMYDFESVYDLYKYLPSYMMIQLYVLLNNYVADFDKTKVITDFAMGNINKMTYEELEYIVEKASKRFFIL